MSFYQFYMPTKILFEDGISENFAQELEGLNVDSVYILSDQNLKKLGLLDGICNHLKSENIKIFGEFLDIPADGSVNVVQKIVDQVAKDQPKAILAIGGGSVIDTGKAVNLIYSLGGNLVEDYSGAQTVNKNLKPLIAIPTTAGTGSEVTEAFVLFDEDSQTKVSFVDKHFLPTLAILDPQLTLGLPKSLTAATAMDALTHAMESMMSVQNNAISDAFATMAIAKIKNALPLVLENPKDLDARSNLMQASNLAGMAFNFSMVGVVHAVAHSVGALCHVHHGLANSLFLAEGITYNFEDAKTEIQKIAKAFGSESAQSFLQDLKDFRKDMHQKAKLPLTYKEAGVPDNKIEDILELALSDGAGFYNPRELDAAALKDLFL